MKLQLISNRSHDFGETSEYYYIAVMRQDDKDDDKELLHLAFTRKEIDRAQDRAEKNPDLVPGKFAVPQSNNNQWWRFWN
jgi:hypothetical protein